MICGDSMFHIVKRSSKLLPIAAVVIGVAVLYAPTLDTGYFADDFDYAVRHAAGEPLMYAVTRNTDATLSGGSWRPFTALSYWVTMRLESPFIDHLVSLALYLVVLAFVYAIARVWFSERSPLFSAIVAALFAALPSHVEPIVWVAARADLLAAIGALAALLLWLKGLRWSALIGIAASLLSKEFWALLGFVLPLMPTAQQFLERVAGLSRGKKMLRGWLGWYASLSAVTLIWLTARYLITGFGAGGYSITAGDE